MQPFGGIFSTPYAFNLLKIRKYQRNPVTINLNITCRWDRENKCSLRAKRLNTASIAGIGNGCRFHRSIFCTTDSWGRTQRSCIQERYSGWGIVSAVCFSSQDWEHVSNIMEKIRRFCYYFESLSLKNAVMGAHLEHRGHCVRGNFRPQRGQTAFVLNVSNRIPHPGELRSPHAQ